MRVILFFVAALMAMVMVTVAAGATNLEPVRLEVNYTNSADAEWQTLPILETDISLTARFVGEIETGFTSEGKPSLYATIVPDKEAPDLVFSETVHGTVYWKPLAHNLFKGSYALTSCEFEADRRGGKIVFFLPPAKPEKFKIITVVPEQAQVPLVPKPTGPPEGEYLRLYWRGEYVDDPIPVIDIRFPVRWEPVDGASLSFDRVLYQWELWGIERNPNITVGTDQPSLPLGWAAAGKELMLQTHDGTIPPAGEITLYFLRFGIAQLQSGNCPRLELRMCDNPQPQSALLTHRNGEWIWLGK